eukprot:gi/632968819/ref/XP_007900739.1/ PREDICTED: galactose-3-O-sulfotransferase 2-like [Callorhinchus milii]
MLFYRPKRHWRLCVLLLFAASLSFSLHWIMKWKKAGDAESVAHVPRTHVVFLKTHKTGSSTVLNILYRFGDKRNLTFALPRKPHLGYPHPFQAKYVRDFGLNSTLVYHIICNHMRFNVNEVKQVVPRESFYFSILRNPISLMESSFVYFNRISPVFRRVKSLGEFMMDPWEYYTPNRRRNQFSRNLMWFDFGYNNDAKPTNDYIDSTIQEIEKVFDLILIMEYFDESLVLLQHSLGWELEDVVYFRLNSRANNSAASLPMDLQEKIKEWNDLDWHLYLHFNATFWRRVRAYGWERMERDVGRLRKRCDDLLRLCVEGGAPVAGKDVKVRKLRPHNPGRVKLLSYNLRANLDNRTRHLCERMALPEKAYLASLTEKQFGSRRKP